MGQVSEQVRNRLNLIFQEVFDDEELQITESMTADDIDEWDSIEHITLVVTIEKEFNIRLNASEIGKLENVGAMIDLLMEKCVGL
jgi:acyl carrier protein